MPFKEVKSRHVASRKRSLQQFGDSSIDLLAEKYDLLVIDHPFIGYAAKREFLVRLDEILPSSFLIEQQMETVGQSFNSYSYDGHQFALPIDAAAQVSAYRPDLITTSLAEWKTVVEEAERRYLAGEAMVGVPLLPTDAFCTFFIAMCKLRRTSIQKRGSRDCRDGPLCVNVSSATRKISSSWLNALEPAPNA